MSNEESTGTKKGAPQQMFDAATGIVLAVLRGGAKGCGVGLKTIGKELEKLGDELQSSDT